MKETLRLWFQEHASRLLIFLGVVLVGGLSFEAGLLKGKMYQASPLVLSIPSLPAEERVVQEVSASDTGAERSPKELVASKVDRIEKCLFVGSKNSNKYHLPTCAVAKRIKTENRVCFSSKEEAEKRGYIPSCLK